MWRGSLLSLLYAPLFSALHVFLYSKSGESFTIIHSFFPASSNLLPVLDLRRELSAASSE